MLGELIGAGASILGGILGNKSAEKAAKQNYKQQKEFAQSGIQWKVKDATKAGIHPLYALGANTHSFSPSNVGSTALGEGIAQAGQNIGRALDSGRSSGERLSVRANELALQRGELENLKLATEIRLLQQPGTPPAPITERAIIDGQGVTSTAPEVIPQQVMGSHPENRAIGPLAKPETEFSAVNLGNGVYGYSPLPSKDTAEQMESSWGGKIDYALRNNVLPRIGFDKGVKPPSSWLPKGYDYWSMNPLTGVYTPMKSVNHRR